MRHRPGASGGLGVLARDQRQQPHRVGLRVVEIDVLACADQLQRVVHQLAHKTLHISRVVPVHDQAPRVQVVLAHPHLGELRHQPAQLSHL